MSARIRSTVLNPSTGAEQSEITGVGIWEIRGVTDLSSVDAARVTFRNGSGADPVGTALSLGVKSGVLTPEGIVGAAMMLPSLATSTATLPVRIYPDGRICVVVTTYVAPFIVEVIQ